MFIALHRLMRRQRRRLAMLAVMLGLAGALVLGLALAARPRWLIPAPVARDFG